MAIALEPLTFDNFKGLREYNGVNAGGQISAIECKNVELIQTEIGSATGIKTMSGNAVLFTLPDNDYEIKGVFKSEQDGIVYEFIYAENETQGRLYKINLARVPESIISSLTKTGECNGLTMSSTAYDVFIFTNGEEAYTICYTDDQGYGDAIKPLNFMYRWKNGSTYKYTIKRNPAVDDYVYEANGTKTTTKITAVATSDGVVTSITVGGTVYTNDGTETKTDRYGQEHEIKFLAMAEWNGYLVVATKYGVRGSHQNDIYTWNDNSNLTAASSWDIDYTERVTALYAYTGGLFIFTNDNTDFLNASPNVTNSEKRLVAGVGCYSYTSIVKHDTFLFFYDNIQKNVYYIQNIDNGQTRPAGPAAREIQSAFKNVESLKMYSCIYDNKNEIWLFITDSTGKQRIFIYNYVLSEWVERDEQKITCLCLVNNTIHTGVGKIVLKEFLNQSYNNTYYASVYQTCFINAGSNTNLKKQKTPLLIVLNDSYINDFWVQLTVNNKAKNPKRVKISTGESGIYGDINEELDIIPDNQKYDTAIYGEYNQYSKKVVEISTPQTWYTMSIKIYTDRLGQGFCINSMELKNMKAKLKTRGR